MNKLEKINSKEYGIEKKQATELMGNLPQLVKERDVLEKQFNEVINLDIEDTETVNKARKLRLLIQKNRTIGINVWHKTTKEYFLKGGQYVDAIKRKQVVINERMENDLLEIEKYAEIKEKERLEKLQYERVSLISEYVEDAISRDLANMENDVWNAYLSTKKKNFEDRIAAEKKAEAERLAKEKAEKQEQERIREENEKLKAEREAKEKELEKAEAKRLRIEELEVKKRAEAESKKQAEFEAKLKKEREERERVELEERKKREKVEAEFEAKLKKEREERERVELEERKKREKVEAEFEAKLKKEREERERVELEERKKREKVEAELKEIREKAEKQDQERLNEIEKKFALGDIEKIKLLIADFEDIKTKYSFKSKKNIKKYNETIILIDKTINFIIK